MREGKSLDQLGPVALCYGPHISDPFRACSIDRPRRAAARHSLPTTYVEGARISSIARDEPYEGLLVSRVHAREGEGMQAHLLIMHNAYSTCLATPECQGPLQVCQFRRHSQAIGALFVSVRGM